MIPICLELHNFKAHKKTKINFNKEKIYVFNGIVDNNIKRSNNAGKSSIFEAINFALWKKPLEAMPQDFTLEDLLHFGETKTKVVFEFISKQRIRIERTVEKLEKTVSSNFKLFTWQEDQWELYKNKNNKDSQEYLELLLGFNQFVWFRAPMISQNSKPELFVTNDKRIENLLNIFDYYETIEKFQEFIKDKLSFYNSISIKKSSIINTYKNLLINKDFEKIIENSKNEIIEIDKKIKSIPDLNTLLEKKKLFENSTSIFKNLSKELMDLETTRRQNSKNLKTQWVREWERLTNDLADKKSKMLSYAKNQKKIVEELENINKEILNGLEEHPFQELIQYNESEENDLYEKINKKNEKITKMKTEEKLLSFQKNTLKNACSTTCPILNESCDRISPETLEPKIYAIQKDMDIVASKIDKNEEAVKDLSKKYRSLIDESPKEKNMLIQFNNDRHEEYQKKYDDKFQNNEDKINKIKKELEIENSKNLKTIEDLEIRIKECESQKPETLNPSQRELDIIKELEKSSNIEISQVLEDIQELEDLENRKVFLNKEIITNEINHSNNLKYLENIQEEQKKKEICDSIIMMYEKSKVTFSKKGFITSYIHLILPALEKITNQYLRFFDQGNLEIKFKDKLMILDKISGSENKPHQISNGQKNVISFCYNMALIYLKFKDSPYSKTICLDEPFENLDPANIEYGLSVILSLFQELNLSNCFVITHKPLETLPDSIEIIEINNNNGIVEFNNLK